MSGILKTLTSRREISRRERQLWRTINDSPMTMRNELIEMRERQRGGQFR